MDIRHLETFLMAAEYKNFTKAAKALGCAQSNVTAQMKQLESQLGVNLFERIGKGVFLTAEGEKLLPYAKKITSLSQEVSGLYKGSGQIKIGVTESVATYLLGDILREFTSLNPSIDIVLNMVDGKDYAGLLSTGEMDIAFVLDSPVKAGYIQIPHRRKENIFLLSSSTHDLAGKSHINPGDFLTYPILLNTKDCPYRKMFEETLSFEGIHPKIALETNSIHVIKESCLWGLGLCLLPEFTVKKELVYHILERLNFKTNYPMYTQILLHQDKWISPALQRLVNIGIKHLS